MTINVNHAPSKTFLTASNINNFGTKIVNMSVLSLKHIKGRVNILVVHISRLKIMDLYDPFSPEEHGPEFSYAVFEPLPTTQMNQIQQPGILYPYS